jgi:pre-mRNA-splicing factor SYF1
MRSPYEPRVWLRYAAHKRGQEGCREGVDFVFERALLELPGSYKLWKAYLEERTGRVLERLNLSGKASASKDDLEHVNMLYERCLEYMRRMPRVWLDYCGFLMKQRKVSMTRRAFDRALQSLPISQHYRVWELYLTFAKAIEPKCPVSAGRIWKRYWRIAPQSAFTQYYETLLRCQMYDDAALLLSDLAGRQSAPDEGEAEEGPPQYWEMLCELVVQHGERITAVDGETVLRQAIEACTKASSYAALQGGQTDRIASSRLRSTGIFWCSLAMLKIRQKHYRAAREIYEEALGRVPTVRDFSLVFDAFAKFEESLLAVAFARAQKGGAPGTLAAALADLEERLARFEGLLERRPFLLQEVRLKQQPHNVEEWGRLVGLLEQSPRAAGERDQEVVRAYERALGTIHSRRARGSLPAFWGAFAQFFESIFEETREGDALASARSIYEAAVASEFATPDELAEMWILYAEFERRHGRPLDGVIDLLGRATATSRSPLLWNYYLDLEEARGLAAPIRAAYDQVLRLGIATVQTFINYAVFLEDCGEAEEAFKVYEKGIHVFGYPMAFELWNIYLPKFIARHAAARLERVRDLFDQALASCPPKYAKHFYLMLLAVEERHGLARSALRVLEAAVKAVPFEDKLAMYQLHLKKTVSSLGVIAARPIYESAIAALPLYDAITLSVAYAGMEAGLGELERARAIFGHAASLADPRTVPSLWQAWNDFEVAHGSEDTFREMLRVKRSGMARFASTLQFIPAQPAAVAEGEDNANDEEIPLEL